MPTRAAVLGPLVVAAVLALWSLNFGLPFLFRPDEDVMVGRAVRMAVDGSLDPLFYNYPPLAFNLFALAARGASLLPGHAIGGATQVDPSVAYLAGRAVSALAFVASVGFVSATGRAASGWLGGLVAALALAVAPLAVREAHFATTDMLATALVAAAIWAGARAGGQRGFLLAGALAGLAAATRYTAGVVLVVPLVMALYGPNRWARAGAAVGGSLLTFLPLMALPGHSLDYLHGLAFLGGRAGQSYGDVAIGLIYHPTVSLPYGLGIGAYTLALGGVALAIRRRRPLDVALLAFLGLSFALLAPSHEVFWRYVLPLLPALCLLAGALAAVPASASMPRWLPAGAALVLLLPSAYASFMTDRLLGMTDTRAQAARWLVANAPAGSEVRITSYWAQPLYDGSELETRPLHPLYLTGDPIADSYEMGLYTDRFRIDRAGGSCYAIIASGPPWQAPVPAASDVLATFTPYSGSGSTTARYDPLDSFYLPIWEFGGLDRPGPSIVIARC